MSSFTISSVAHLAKAAYPAQKQSPQQESSRFHRCSGKCLRMLMIHSVPQTRQQKRLVTGKTTDLHQVMIAAEKASLTLQTTLEIRNKVVEAYQEVMRTQL